jgi:2-polyprenyl-6-methoxyphenol hydroxylase-like FAD-dependent oxidoreductase
MGMERRILIAGAGIAGPTLAWWLHRYGWRVTVIERSPSLRTAGQNVDVRGAAREVIRRMGLDDEVAARGTGEQGTRFVDAAGRTIAAFPAAESDTAGATAEREILRSQLARLLFERTRGDVDYRFGGQIEAVRDEMDGATVTFADGATERFDVVAIAEGVNSATRTGVFGTVPRRPLGVSVAYFSIPRVSEDDDWWRWYNAAGGRTISLRPDNVGRIRVMLSFRAGPGEPGPRELAARFTGAGWQADRVIGALDGADDLYGEALQQVRAPRWATGRVVLLGDAAWCATPVSGMGTSLALVGAYVLAGELAAHVHHRDAFAGYERVLRPYVERAQQLPPGTPKLAHPTSTLGVGVLRTVLRLVGAAPQAVADRLFAPPADRLTLPDYRHLETRSAAPLPG